MDRRRFTQSALGVALVSTLPLSQAFGAGTAESLTKITTDLEAITRTGGKTILSKAAMKELQDSLRGELLLSTSEGYDDARRVFNAMFDKRPGLIVRCWGAGDIRNVVDFARSNDLLVAVKAGGHSISGKSGCDGGLLIDLAPMRGVRVDPIAKTARAQAGALLGHLDTEAQQFALATTSGTVSHTGIAGLTLGGGVGRLGRRFGLTCDNVRAFDIITADGKFRHASAQENPDLYWGLRGGGGNFGIVTSFEYQLHNVGPMVLAGAVVYPLEQAQDVFDFYAEFSANAPNELSADALVFARSGREPAISITLCYSGPMEDGERAIAPLLAFGKPKRSEVGPMSYVKLQSQGDNTTPGGQYYYSGGGVMAELAPEALKKMVDRMGSLGEEITDPSRGIMIGFQLLGGAIAQRSPEDTAYPHRDAHYDFVLASRWTDPDYSEINVKHMRDLNAMMEPYTIGYYSNFQGDDENASAKLAYRGNYDRMVELKNTYDPTNLFQLNANVEPTI